jgi:hypothetical protein
MTAAIVAHPHRRYAVLTFDSDEKPAEVIEIWEGRRYQLAFKAALETLQSCVWEDLVRCYAIARLFKNGNVERVLYVGARSRLYAERPVYAGVLEAA